MPVVQAHVRRFAVHNRTALGQEIRRAIRKSFDGNRSLAARRVKLHIQHLQKFERSEIGHVTEATWKRLEALVGSDRKPSIRRTIVSAGADKRFRAYVRWLQREVRNAESRGFDLWAVEREVTHRLAPHARAKWSRIIAAHRRTLDGQLRVQLALWRIWQPLLDADPSRIERRGRDLHPDELSRFVTAGVARESILLRRPPALECAQEIAAMRGGRATSSRKEIEERRAQNRAELARIGVAEWNKRLESHKRPTRP